MYVVVVLQMKVHESAKTEGITFNSRQKVNDDSIPIHVKGYTHTNHLDIHMYLPRSK